MNAFSATRTSFRTNVLLFCVFAVFFGAAFLRIYFRTQTTLLGYEIGRLKTKEAQLLLVRSQLQSQYASLTTKENLQKFAKLERRNLKRPTNKMERH